MFESPSPMKLFWKKKQDGWWWCPWWLSEMWSLPPMGYSISVSSYLFSLSLPLSYIVYSSLSSSLLLFTLLLWNRVKRKTSLTGTTASPRFSLSHIPPKDISMRNNVFFLGKRRGEGINSSGRDWHQYNASCDDIAQGSYLGVRSRNPPPPLYNIII